MWSYGKRNRMREGGSVWVWVCVWGGGVIYVILNLPDPSLVLMKMLGIPFFCPVSLAIGYPIDEQAVLELYIEIPS